MAAGPRNRCAFLIAFALALVVLVPDMAVAASRVCRQLEAELAGAGRPRPSQASGKQDAAIARQREQLRLAKRQARGAGCGFRLFGGGSSSCDGLRQKIDGMERNLATLERRRARSADAGGRSRSQIMAALEANGCRERSAAQRDLPRGLDGPRNLLDRLFGGAIGRRDSAGELGAPALRGDENRQARQAPRPEGGWVNDGGRIRYMAPPDRYRTLCVRACDGYFFPLSASSTPSNFERDQANCQSSCPGTAVELYYHRPDQQSADMVSGLSGQPYADLPAAWLYRQTGVPSPAGCSCSALKNGETKNYSTIAGSPPAAAPSPAAPETASAPETPAGGDGGLDAEAPRPTAVAPEADRSTAPASGRKVRVVGPAFLPAPEEAADPPAPVRTEAR